MWHYLIIIGLVILVIGIISMRKKKNSSQDSLDLLKQMYVNGDLTEEEYLKRKNVIERK
jgi:putative membrane protein